jgi:hypothetical protein
MGSVKWLLVAVAVALLSTVAMANPVISGSASTIDNVTWTYAYTFNNVVPDANNGSIFDVVIPTAGVINNITAAPGWIAMPAAGPISGVGYVDFTTFGSEVAPGASLSGFSFTSDKYPAYWFTTQVTTETGGVSNDILTVATLVPSPEPTTIIYMITAMGLGAGYFGARTRKNLGK